jgi:tetratricopeptide (TPR) repeat protein
MPQPQPATDARPGDSEELASRVALLELCTDMWGPCHQETFAAAHQLGIAFWEAGHGERAIGLLDQALDGLTSTLGREHPLRLGMLSTLGEILFDQRHLDQAGAVQREVLACCVERSGANHPTSLEAKGTLAAILFELGDAEEAGRLEQEAFEAAQQHLDKTHPVACVLAWNRAMSYEGSGDPDAARRLIVDQLVWLLAEDPEGLEDDARVIRAMLAERLDWNAPRAC